VAPLKLSSLSRSMSFPLIESFRLLGLESLSEDRRRCHLASCERISALFPAPPNVGLDRLPPPLFPRQTDVFHLEGRPSLFLPFEGASAIVLQCKCFRRLFLILAFGYPGLRKPPPRVVSG